MSPPLALDDAQFFLHIINDSSSGKDHLTFRIIAEELTEHYPHLRWTMEYVPTERRAFLRVEDREHGLISNVQRRPVPPAGAPAPEVRKEA